MRPEKDGGVTLQGGQGSRYATATESNRDALTRCTTLSVAQDGSNPSVGDGAGPTPDQRAPSAAPSAPANGDGNPSAGQEPSQTPSFRSVCCAFYAWRGDCIVAITPSRSWPRSTGCP